MSTFGRQNNGSKRVHLLIPEICNMSLEMLKGTQDPDGKVILHCLDGPNVITRVLMRSLSQRWA